MAKHDTTTPEHTTKKRKIDFSGCIIAIVIAAVIIALCEIVFTFS